MYSTIVVPLDGSPFGERALPVAVALARRTDAVLDLVHVREPEVRASGAPARDTRFDDEAEERVRVRVSSLADTLTHDASLATRAVFLYGEIAAAVQAYVAERAADLVVMTTHGRGGISRTRLGSVADALVRRATAPVLLIRPDTEGTAAVPSVAHEPLFRRVLVPLDGSPRAEEVLTQAATLGTPDATEYLLLSVVVPRAALGPAPEVGVMMDRADLAGHLEHEQARAGAYLARVAESLREIGARVTTHTRVNGHAGRAILDFAGERDVDLIVLSARVRSAAERLLIGSVADKVVRGAAVTVLLCGPRVEVASATRDAASVTESGAASAAMAR